MSGQPLREKDQALAARCRRLAEVSRGALDWFRDNPKLAGNRLEALERTCRAHTVLARKLATAAERPMSVGVFGASQAGKSFLIGSLITPHGRPAKVVFGEGPQARKLDFLEEVNPQGGKETTGVVTRFSIQPHQALPGHEVVLRLLGEVDIAKILANSFVFDLGAQAEQGCEVTTDRLTALETELAARLRPERVDALALEDVFELRAYVAHSLQRHPLADKASGGVAARYWAMAEACLPRLAAEDRARALSLLWGELREFTDLYRELKGALDQLSDARTGTPEFAYVPVTAIEDRTRSLVHVDTLLGLDRNDGEATAALPVAVPGGRVARLRTPVVTALTAELRVTLDEAAWPFFTHTDLLDFPGARSREDSTPAKLLRDEKQVAPRAYCFLRGKVAVLFDKYAADLDLNTMLLCVGPENQEVKKLPELVQDWIAQTHGPTPEERVGHRTSLFLCMTKADTLFDFSTGASPERTITNRLDNNINNFPGWTGSWTPGKPFANSFLIRNPKGKKREDLFDYDEQAAPGEEEMPPERGLRADKADTLTRYREEFLKHPMVREHVADAAEKWDAVLTLNDGGITYLAQHLAPVCDPDLKYDQVAPRAASLAQQLTTELASFHEAGDVQKRVEERRKAAEAIMRALASKAMLFGPFLAELQADPARLGQRFLEVARRQGATEAGPGEHADHGGIVIDLGFDEPEQPAAPPPMRFGDEAVKTWLDDLERKAGDEELARAFGLTCEQFRTVVAELAVGARRFELAQRVEAHVTTAEAYAQTASDVVHRVAMGSALIVNRLVNQLGTEEAAPRARPPAPGEPPALPAERQEMTRIRGQLPTFWLRTFRQLATENAAWGQGGLVDVEQNRRLGLLLDKAKE